MKSRLTDKLMGLTQNLEAAVAQQQDKVEGKEDRYSTLPGKLGAFRVEAERYQNRIRELENSVQQLEGRLAETGETSSRELEAVREAKRQLEAAHQEELERLKAELDFKAKQTIGTAVDLPLDRIKKIPGRQRTLAPEERAALKANLALHPLVTPVTVEPDPDQPGYYFMNSGHNRLDLYQELEKPTIKAVVQQFEPGTSGKAAFYANLMHNSLPDFEKYLGFKRLMEENPGLTVSAAAADAGLPRSTVQSLMVYGNLPPAALELLASKPSVLGRNAANELVKAAAKGFGDDVVAVIGMLVAGEIEKQDEAVTKVNAKIRAAERARPGRPAAAAAPSQAMRADGRVKDVELDGEFCKVQRSGATLSLVFASEADVEAVLPDLEALLKRREALKRG